MRLVAVHRLPDEDGHLRPGDRVVAYLPNVVEAVAAFHACASLGAIWSSCSPDFGVKSVVDRFAQIEPRVLLAVDGYRYGGRDHDRLDVVASLQRAMPSLERIVVIGYLDPEPDLALRSCPHGQIPRWIGLLPYEARRALERGPRDDARPAPDVTDPTWFRY